MGLPYLRCSWLPVRLIRHPHGARGKVAMEIKISLELVPFSNFDQNTFSFAETDRLNRHDVLSQEG